MDITEFDHYRSYLSKYIKESKASVGLKSRIAEALNCQPAYISRVLNGQANFSLEQAEMLNRFLGHSEWEADYFLLLLQENRAGTTSLKRYFNSKRKQTVKNSMDLKYRFQIDEITDSEVLNTYYSRWYYAAIHVLVSLPNLTTVEKISSYLGIPTSIIKEATDFLIAAKLILKKGSHLVPGKRRIHLGKNSQHLSKHHTNWRLQAISEAEIENQSHLHYSSVVSLSQADFDAIRKNILNVIEKQKKVIRDSPEEIAAVFNVDLFELRKSTQNSEFHVL